MNSNDTPVCPPHIEAREPRWPAVVAGLAFGLIFYALPESLAVGPRWLVMVIVIALTIPTVVSHRKKKYLANRFLGFVSSGIITLFMLWSLTLLILAMLKGKEDAMRMVGSAVTLWVGNILNFALWYWRLDGGGPNGRDLAPGHDRGAFLFPQMTEEGASSAVPDSVGRGGRPCWSPHFIDYLFIAFNTSTAFSPTDCPVLSRWAKALTMIQSTISLAIVVLLAARAVNILTPAG
jgi:uncharacterized membrane protein